MVCILLLQLQRMDSPYAENKVSPQSRRVADLVMRLQAQSQEQREISRRARLEQKVRLSKSCRQIEPDKKPVWAPNLHRHDFFQEKPFAAYKFIPRYKQEQLIFPDRVLERGARRMHIKMLDTSVGIFPMSETDDINRLLHKGQKKQTIENRKLLELDRILDENDGRLRAKRLRRHQPKFVAPTGKSGLFASDPGFLNEQKISETELMRKTSLPRSTEINGWRPASRVQKEFSQTAKSQVLSSFMVTKPQQSFDPMDLP